MDNSVFRTPTGFTLIELLVVIAIIGILAAILFPVFAQAKAAAKNTQDLSNVRQIGMSSVLYMTDADDRYVPIGSWDDPTITPFTNPLGPAPGQPWNGWPLKLLNYTTSRAIFRSPFMPQVANWWTGPCATSNGMQITSTFAMNWNLGSDTDAEGPPWSITPDGTVKNTPLSSSEISQPANVMAYQLSQTGSSYGNSFGCDYNFIESGDWDNRLRWHAVYNGGGNLAFADGHAKFFVAKQADSASCNGAPSYDVFIWASRNMWAWPGYPQSTGGFPTEPVSLGCQQ